MRQYKSQSADFPQEWDDASSASLTYHNTDIIAVEGEDGTMYEYNVTEYTKAEYEVYKQTKIRSDVDYLAVVSEVNLNE